ncbi:ribonuclease H-like YkuK family protein [bacterium]|nr:ribonuclease H-like YkuK family protein [bacterium]
MRYWRKLTGERLQGELYDVVENTILEEIELHRLKVCIGTDSQVKGDITEFATAIVFLREGKGGFIYLSTYKTDVPYTIKERMIKEVSDSIEIAYKLCPLFDRYNVEMEVHADINSDPQFKSNVAFKEAMGYIMGMGYTFRAKPDAFASTYCANKVVK